MAVTDTGSWVITLNARFVNERLKVVDINGISGLARRAHLSRQIVNDALNNGACVSSKTVSAIAVALAVSPADCMVWQRVAVGA